MPSSGHYCHTERLVYIRKPNPGEVNVYGIQTAEAMACRRFLKTAVEAILTGQGDKYERCYRDIANSSGLEEELEIMFRIKEDNNDHIYFLELIFDRRKERALTKSGH